MQNVYFAQKVNSWFKERCGRESKHGIFAMEKVSIVCDVTYYNVKPQLLLQCIWTMFWKTFMTFSMFLATFLLFLRLFTMLHYIFKIHLLTIADFWIRFYLAINIACNVDLQKNYKYHLLIFSAYEWPKYRSVHENENKDIFLLEMYKRLSCKPIIRYVCRLPSKRNSQTVASRIIKPKI